MARKPQPIPMFETEAEERAFWEGRDSATRVDWHQADRVAMPNLTPTREPDRGLARGS